MPKKIYELAKELDIGALALVEKLKAEGYAVRNHMNSLSDDEVEKVQGMFAAEEEEKAKETKSKTKKKTTKKKKAKKKVTKRKVVTVKKKTGVVKMKDETGAEEIIEPKKSEVPEDSVEATQAQAEEVSMSEESPAEEAQSVGLRVVKRPPKKEKVTEESVTDDSEVTEESPDKLHTFTPVYIPEKKAKKGTEEEVEVEGDEEDGDGDKKSSKKRLGGLAAMMAKPKAVNKARDITQLRADEELKTYSVGIIGKSLYTQPKRKKSYSGPTRETEKTTIKDAKRILSVYDGATAEELAQKLSVKFDELADKALELNLLLKPEDFLGVQLASDLASLYGWRVENRSFDESEVLEKPVDESELKARNPIITIMGHVDHGKTTLLDYIRNAKVAEGEAGGITQHIGAYSVKVKDSVLTFLDTPGHAAFGAIRERGAEVTDIVVLVVAADDGVMPQTKESIRFCQQRNVPIIVAVNKMDKEGANPDRVKQELMEFALTPEEWGGETQYVEISALQGSNVDKLLESISLQAEMMELKANPEGGAEGVVIEAKVETGRGPVTTVLVQTGTLTKGDIVVVGKTFGRVRSMMDYAGKMLKKAGPSTPVEVLGLNDVPEPGDEFHRVSSEREAKKIIENRIDESRKMAQANKKKYLEDFYNEGGEGGKRVLKLIIRSDVHGSYEAIKSSLESLGNDEVGVQVIGGGVGPINDNDVQLAESANGYIIGFNMRPVTSARRLAEEKGVDVRTYSIIYELIDDIRKALEGMLEPDSVEVFIGRAEVRDLFSVPRVGMIAGSSVIDGKIQRGCNIRLLRDGKIVFEGKMSSLKRFKDDVKEVNQGYECGIGLENFNDIKKDDIFEAYVIEQKKRKLEESEKVL